MWNPELENRRTEIARRSHYSFPHFKLMIAMGLACLFTHQQSAEAVLIDLDFSNPVQETDGTFGAPLNADYISDTVIDFEEAFSGVDVRITVTTIGTDHSYFGSFPDYHANSGPEPNNDLGALYFGNTNNTTGGISYRFDLYQSDGLVNDTVQTSTPFVADDVRILVYDVDGEPAQDERACAYLGDGFYSYRVANIDPLTVRAVGSGYEFEGPGQNRSELDASAATILRFLDTSGFTIDLEATTFTNAPNGVFQAFDGDLSLADLNDFGNEVIVGVPEPNSSYLSAMAVVMLLVVKRFRGSRLLIADRTA